jgi:hypothetical protein
MSHSFKPRLEVLPPEQKQFARKLRLILQRVEAKDYLDIAALMKSGLSLADGLSAARALYGQAFQPAESLKALVYFQGGDLSSLSPEVRQTLVQASSRVRDLPSAKTISSKLL